MSRRSARLTRTRACGAHLLYRSEIEAQVKASWQPAVFCDRCQRGKVWHVFRCGDHWHAGHGSLAAMASA